MQAQFIWPTFKKLGKCRIRGKKNLDVSFTNGTFGHSRPVFIQGGGAARVGMDGKQAGFENEPANLQYYYDIYTKKEPWAITTPEE